MKSSVSIALFFLLSGFFLTALLGAIEHSRKLLGISGAFLVVVVCVIVFLTPVQLPPSLRLGFGGDDTDSTDGPATTTTAGVSVTSTVTSTIASPVTSLPRPAATSVTSSPTVTSIRTSPAVSVVTTEASVSKPPDDDLTYRSAGVDIEAGEEAVRRIKEDVESTYIPGVLGSLGGFAGLFELPKELERPVLVTATDGVGTKVLIAQEIGRLDTVGIDLVAMAANDMLTVGARPILFLDYVAAGRLVPDEVAQVVDGVAVGCRRAGCALVGGEMAEMPGLYAPGEFDLAGFCVGLADGTRPDRRVGYAGRRHRHRHPVERFPLQRLLPGPQGLGLERHGLGRSIPGPLRPSPPHSSSPPASTCGACWTLLERAYPSRPWLTSPAGASAAISAVWYPTGCPPDWTSPNGRYRPCSGPSNVWATSRTRVMFRTFNMGVGYVLVVPVESAERAVGVLVEAGEEAVRLGVVAPGTEKVVLDVSS